MFLHTLPWFLCFYELFEMKKKSLLLEFSSSNDVLKVFWRQMGTDAQLAPNLGITLFWMT